MQTTQIGQISPFWIENRLIHNSVIIAQH